MHLHTNIPLCPYCKKEKNVLLIDRRIRSKRQEYGTHKVIVLGDFEPCDECQKIMDTGIALIEAVIKQDQKGTSSFPHPTGNFWVVSEDFIRKCITPKEFADQVLAVKKSLIDPDSVTKLGLREAEPMYKDISELPVT